MLVSELDINDTKIVLTDGDKFVWEEVEGVGDYLLRLLESNFSKENSLLRDGTSTSVEIPYSSLPFKSDTKKRPLKVVIEVWAIGYSSVTVKGTRYTNVGMYESYTSFSSKRKISSLFYRGKNFCLYLTSVLYCRGCLRVCKMFFILFYQMVTKFFLLFPQKSARVQQFPQFP